MTRDENGLATRPVRPSTDKARLSARAHRKRRAKRPHEPADMCQMVGRVLHALGDKMVDGDPNELAMLAALRDQVDAEMARVVAGQRAAGFADGEIGAHLGGISKQAVAQRWPRKEAT